MTAELAVSDMFKHVVIVGWKTKQGNNTITDFAVGFLAERSGDWYIITAGHVICDLIDQRNAGLQHIDWNLYDGLSANSNWASSIPFRIPHQSCNFINEYGVDLAAIPIPHLVREDLEKNGKIPFIESSWAHPDETGENLGYMMLGTPTETLIDKSPQGLAVGLAAIHIKPIALDEVPQYEGKSDKYFHGKLKEVPIKMRSGEIIQSLQGMSGGPILRFRHYPSGEITYKVLAVQSGWLKESGITTATYLRPWLERLLQTSSGG